MYAVATINGQEEPGVLLSGRAFVSWSSRPTLPPVDQRPRRFKLTMDVGGKVEGIVLGVTPTDPGPGS